MRPKRITNPSSDTFISISNMWSDEYSDFNPQEYLQCDTLSPVQFRAKERLTRALVSLLRENGITPHACYVFELMQAIDGPGVYGVELE